MISSIRGTLKRKYPDRVVVDVQGIGYDVFLPQFVMRTVDERPEGEPIEFDIYYHVTDRQLRPTLIGFNNETERRFFEKFITVEDIGPQKAARALIMSVSTIAEAIETEDIALLRKLPGIGERTAKKMVATLRGKVVEEALLRDEGFRAVSPAAEPAGPVSQLREDGIDILVNLGYRRSEAMTKVDAALKRNPELATPEDLIREVYRGEREATAPSAP
ncbi:MAG: Holliday junction branch migration protein RuvA [Chloroflexi bacterium]|nr:Holliday junction branch migration protein RuvA [Chloroflexota bacterium]